MQITPPTEFDPAWLIIGYGNPLRRDDGVGPRVAEIIDARNLPGVRTQTAQQLNPEDAEPISRAGKVIFVDAAVDHGGGILLRPLEPGATSQLMAHAADPRTVLALARDVFGRAPAAWWLTIPAVHLGFGTDFSPAAEAGVHAAVAEIERLVSGNFREDPPASVG